MWDYPRPPRLVPDSRHVLVKAGSVVVAGERVTPQPGGFYAGWVTREIVGPCKGEPGSEGW
ncbi:MAG: hypothetical protein M5U32_05090 [Myxococcota bacterium]|nr:hypothetical protein [Myxococcota bacterium]